MIHRKTTGFTIVELLIVIVIIGILATITIVAYNGVQQRANNTKTTQAVAAWVKAMTLYKADEGHWPVGWVCLGDGYSYGVSGKDSTGTAQCRQTGAAGYTQNAAFDDLIKPYTGGALPTPAFVTAVQDSTNWKRGLMYASSGGGDGKTVYIEAVYAGAISVCPAVSGTTTARFVWGANSYCLYTLGKNTDS